MLAEDTVVGREETGSEVEEPGRCEAITAAERNARSVADCVAETDG